MKYIALLILGILISSCSYKEEPDYFFVIPNSVNIGGKTYNFTHSGTLQTIDLEKYYYSGSGEYFSITKYLYNKDSFGESWTNLQDFYTIGLKDLQAFEIETISGSINQKDEGYKKLYKLIANQDGVYYSGSTSMNMFEIGAIFSGQIQLCGYFHDSKDYYRGCLTRFNPDQEMNTNNIENAYASIEKYFKEMRNYIDFRKGDISKIFTSVAQK